MNIPKKKCPCCDAPQTFFSLKGQRGMYPCEIKKNYVCLHCAVCNNQIGKPIHAIVSHVFAIGLLFVSWWIASSLREVFDLWIDCRDIFFDTPIMFIVYLIISYFIWYFTPLNCIKTDHINKFEDIDPLHIENNPSLTPIEQNIVKQGIKLTLFVQILLLIAITLGIIYIWLQK